MRQHDSGSARHLLLLSRVLAVLTLVALVSLFGSAGVLVQDGTGLNLHGTAAVSLHVLSGLLALALALRAWASGTGLWVAITAVCASLLTYGQAELGGTATLAFHIVGSLVLAMLFTAVTAWSFMPGRSRAEPSQSPGSPGAHRTVTRRTP